tara:strand:+ start:321 stop:482 length:162 start_codon:yes stop_codon:yes gene_type:complete
MHNKKAAKKLLKRAKKHPEWYTEKDIYYAKMIRKEEKLRKHDKEKSKSDISDT